MLSPLCEKNASNIMTFGDQTKTGTEKEKSNRKNERSRGERDWWPRQKLNPRKARVWGGSVGMVGVNTIFVRRRWVKKDGGTGRKRKKCWRSKETLKTDSNNRLTTGGTTRGLSEG